MRWVFKYEKHKGKKTFDEKTLDLKTRIRNREILLTAKALEKKQKQMPFNNGNPLNRSRTGLTNLQDKFVTAFANPRSKTFKQVAKSYMAAKPGVSLYAATRGGTRLLKDKKVIDTLKTLLNTQATKLKIKHGLNKILSDPDDRRYIEAAKLVYEMVGEKTPEQHLHAHLNPKELSQQRDEKYKEIMEKVKQARAMIEDPLLVAKEAKKVEDSFPTRETEVVPENDEVQS